MADAIVKIATLENHFTLKLMSTLTPFETLNEFLLGDLKQLIKDIQKNVTTNEIKKQIESNYKFDPNTQLWYSSNRQPAFHDCLQKVILKFVREMTLWNMDKMTDW